MKVHAWNACVRRRTVGSNPTLSARNVFSLIAGSCATEPREPRQVREEATVARSFVCRRGAWLSFFGGSDQLHPASYGRSGSHSSRLCFASACTNLGTSGRFPCSRLSFFLFVCRSASLNLGAPRRFPLFLLQVSIFFSSVDILPYC